MYPNSALDMNAAPLRMAPFWIDACVEQRDSATTAVGMRLSELVDANIVLGGLAGSLRIAINVLVYGQGFNRLRQTRGGSNSYKRLARSATTVLSRSKNTFLWSSAGTRQPTCHSSHAQHLR